jgi:hypothetical protein
MSVVFFLNLILFVRKLKSFGFMYGLHTTAITCVFHLTQVGTMAVSLAFSSILLAYYGQLCCVSNVEVAKVFSYGIRNIPQ